MQTLFDTIALYLGYIIYFMYNMLWFNYGLAIIFFTVILRIFLLPLAVKSVKSMAQMKEIQPIVNEIQRKYKNDKETLNKELMKVYQEKKVNPLGGCFPMIVQILILYSLFLVIAQPITYMFKLPEIVQTNIFAKNTLKTDYYNQVKFLDLAHKDKKVYEEAKKEILEKTKDSNIVKQIEQTNIEKMDLYLFGINFGDKPELIPPEKERTKYLILWILPLLTGITTYISTKYGQIQQDPKDMTDMQRSMNTQMLVMMPFMTFYFSFLVPAGLSLYWIVSNLLQLVQQKVLMKYFINKKEA